MCGIAGIFNPSRNRDSKRLSDFVGKMLDAATFRGPDHQGVWSDSRYASGTNRLMVTGGFRRGTQPLLDERGGVFTFNGEVYEPEKLARRLHESFSSQQSDGVVLAELLHQRGPHGLEGISAMFALAYYDSAERTLLLARDAYGQKPLYYRTMSDGTLAFASTLASLHVVAGPFTVREDAIDEYLIFKSIGGTGSAFEDVDQLGPGCWMKIDSEGTVTHGRWHEIPEPDHQIAVDPEEIERYLLQAVSKRICPRFRPTVLLSGGLDSSIVAAGVSRHSSPDEPALALSIGYDIPGEEDETKYAARLAGELGMDHEVVTLHSHDVPDMIETVAGFLEDPVEDPITLPYFAVTRYAAQRTRVVLTGDGSDEFWGGYDRFENPPDSFGEYLLRTMVFRPDEIGLGEAPESYIDSVRINSSLDPLDRIMRGEVQNRLRNYHLSRIDKLSMASSLEVRCPFLDLELSDMAMRIPATFKRDGTRVKIPLLDASRNILPEWLLNRKKQPFSGPVLGWLQGPLASRLRAMDDRTNPRISDRIDVSALLSRFADPANSRTLATRVWSMVFLETWLDSVATRFSKPATEALNET